HLPDGMRPRTASSGEGYRATRHGFAGFCALLPTRGADSALFSGGVLGELLTSIFGTQGLIVGTIIPFLFVLLVVVFIHEMGHYLVRRLCGIGVKAFSIGFGPELFGFNDRHGTRWKLSAIPLGGYVKFVGDMAVTSEPDKEEMDRLSEEEKRVAFHTQPVWKRALTVFAGPFFNFLLTIAVFAVMFAVF